ncbi:hypothetical protein PHLCEN_2v10066 [Hermanssonia centrifuga]|uniref:Nuclear cap-binding protein subunit 2 n=1 Tax=Hermanssonia centrifuga TaxID=98765 RepID=A0A2R6NNT4_9APHY|nr:hypothetical protein PHLCEN_2v10066 [Hermanssonia centrifuga]
MAHVVQSLDQPSNYKDSQARVDRQKQNELLAKSTTLYVWDRPQIVRKGSGTTTSIALIPLYRTPCGFCFVEYYTHAEALASLRYISGTKLDERIIRCDLDLGYREGRQFGRGKSGGQKERLQVRDEHRSDYDPGRGGWGAQAQRVEIERRREVEERYADAQEGPGAVAGGGDDWKEAEGAVESSLKRGRSPDDDGDNARMGARTRLDEAEPEAERM